MLYQTSARAYRPQSFEHLRGQEYLVKSLSHNIQNEKIGHAYLFSGPRGVGKTSTARILAKSLNCEVGISTKPCQECSNCIEITHSKSCDVFEIDGASNRGIDQIRELRENVSYLPSKSRYKIFIIDEVHMLTDQAFNALLKTLEEPPPHVIFIFATTEAHKVKTTIRSRCQHYRLKKISLQIIKDAIKEVSHAHKLEIDETALHIIARLSDGSLRDSHNLLDQLSSYSTHIQGKLVEEVLGIVPLQYYTQFIEALLNKSTHALLAHIEEITHKGEDLEQYALGLIETFRNILLLEHISDKDCTTLDIPQETISALKPYTQKIQRLTDILFACMELHQKLKTATYPKYVFESYALRILHINELQTPSEILQRLHQLQTRIESTSSEQIQSIHEHIPPHTHTTPQNSKPPDNHWQSFLNYLGDHNMKLFGAVKNATRHTLQGNTLHLYWKETQGIINSLLNENDRKHLEHLYQEHLHCQVTIKFFSEDSGTHISSSDSESSVKVLADGLEGKVLSN